MLFASLYLCVFFGILQFASINHRFVLVRGRFLREGDSCITPYDRSGLANRSVGIPARTVILLFLRGLLDYVLGSQRFRGIVVWASLPALRFYFFEGTIGLRPWIAEVSPMVVRGRFATQTILFFYWLFV